MGGMATGNLGATLSRRRYGGHPPPQQRRWIGIAQNVLLILATLVTLYLVYLAMTRPS